MLYFMSGCSDRSTTQHQKCCMVTTYIVYLWPYFISLHRPKYQRLECQIQDSLSLANAVNSANSLQLVGRI